MALELEENKKKSFMDYVYPALTALDYPRQKLLEGTYGLLGGEEEFERPMRFGDIVEQGMGEEFMRENPKTYAALSTAGDFIYDPLMFVGGGLLGGGSKAARTGMRRLATAAPNPIQRPNMGNLALTQDITRRTHGYQTRHPAGLPDWYGGGMVSKGAHLFGGMLPRAVSDVTQRLIDPKAAYVFDKYGISPTNARELKRLFKYMEEGGKKKGLFGRSVDDAPNIDPSQLRNEIHSQLAYISSIFRKYLPDDKRREAFEKEIIGHVFPRQRYTTSTNISTDAKAIREVLDLPPQISDAGINAHIGSVIPTGFGKRLEGSISLNAKPYQQHPAASMITGYKVSARPMRDFQTVLGELKQGQKISRETVLDEARLYNDLLDERAAKKYSEVFEETMSRQITKSGALRKTRIPHHRLIRETGERPFVVPTETRHLAHNAAHEARQTILNTRIDVGRLSKSIKDEAGYLSVGGPSLSADRLLAHINNRIIVKKDGSLEGVWVTFDQMKQGTGVPIAEQILDVGSKHHFIAMDVQPLRVGMGREGYRAYYNPVDLENMVKEFGMSPATMRTRSVLDQTPMGVGTKLSVRDKALREATERMMYARPDASYLTKWGLKRGALAGGGSAAAYGYGMLDDEEEQRRRRGGLLAY